MPTATAALQEERRRFLRNEPSAPFGVSLLQPNGAISVNSVNVSEAGLCLRLQERFEVHSLVRLQLMLGRSRLHPKTSVSSGVGAPGSGLLVEPPRAHSPQPRATKGFGTSASSVRPVECVGRVAWIIQRLDLRQEPPFLFDVGIELIKPPLLWRQSLAQTGALPVSPAYRAVRKGLEAVTIRNRRYVPALEHVPTQALRWHVVISVDGVPCFSGRYASERAALVAWATFKRQQAKRREHL